MQTFTHDDLDFEVLDAGPADGPVVVLLHGFPQDATAFAEVARLLGEEGVRTLAPHQRGYSPGARPRSVAAYRMPHLVGDVVALLDAAGVQQAVVVGHDWGGAVAWEVGRRHPERVSGLVVLSTPHPAALAQSLRRSDQARRSWYILSFQTPRLPERLVARMLRRDGMPALGMPAEHAARYAARLGTAEALRGPINWYRAAFRSALRPPRRTPGRQSSTSGRTSGARVRVPTTYIWGNRDAYLGRAAAELTADHVAGVYDFVEVAADHWLPEKEAALVVHHVLRRLGRAPRASGDVSRG